MFRPLLISLVGDSSVAGDWAALPPAPLLEGKSQFSDGESTLTSIFSPFSSLVSFHHCSSGLGLDTYLTNSLNKLKAKLEGWGERRNLLTLC